MVQRVDASWGAESARVAALSAAVTDRVERILPVAMLPRMLLFSEEFQVTINWKCRGGESAARPCQCTGIRVSVCVHALKRLPVALRVDCFSVIVQLGDSHLQSTHVEALGFWQDVVTINAVTLPQFAWLGVVTLTLHYKIANTSSLILIYSEIPLC